MCRAVSLCRNVFFSLALLSLHLFSLPVLPPTIANAEQPDAATRTQRGRMSWTPPSVLKNEPFTGNDSLKGKTPNAVTKRLGRPDKKNVSGGVEVWSYGKSTVTFTRGRVSGWSDLGDLDAHALAPKPSLNPIRAAVKTKSPSEERDPVRRLQWINDWTPLPDVTADAVLVDLMRE